MKKHLLGLVACAGFCFALIPPTVQAQTRTVQQSYTAPGDSTAMAKSKPGTAGAVSVKEKQAKKKVTTITTTKMVPADQVTVDENGTTVVIDAPVQPATAMETLKQKVADDQANPQPVTAEEEIAAAEPEIPEMTKKINYGQDVQDWVAEPGATVQTLLNKWSDESGWTLVWKLDRDYILEAGVVFRGTYMDVSMALLRSFARAIPAPIGTFYKGNRVLVVSTREDENEG